MDPTLINLKFIGLKYNDNESSEWMSQKINLHFGQKPETHLKLSTPVAVPKSARFAILGKLNKYCVQNRYLEFVATIKIIKI